jgi:hypothetical protein
MENAERLALASESCQVAAFALAGGDLFLAELALDDAVNVLELPASKLADPSLIS